MPAGSSPLSPAERDTLRRALSGLSGVHHVVIDADSVLVSMICDPDVPEVDGLEVLARARLVEAGMAERVRLETSFRTEAQPRRRVRFIDASLKPNPNGSATASVTLEWGGDEYARTATGVHPPGGELRLVAEAAANALSDVLRGGLGFHVIGVRQLRVFDRELVVVLVRTRGTPNDWQLVGSCLAGTNVQRSAAIAVLNATNRVLGNFLHSDDG